MNVGECKVFDEVLTWTKMHLKCLMEVKDELSVCICVDQQCGCPSTI